MLRPFIRYLTTLFGLQLVAAGLVFLVADLAWLAIPVGLAFLVLVWLTGRSVSDDLGGRPAWVCGLFALAVGLLWQLPGLLAPVRFLREELGLVNYDGLSDLLDFLAESWHMGLMPLLATIPAGTVDGYHARYYAGLLLLSPLLILLFALAASLSRRHGKG